MSDMNEELDDAIHDFLTAYEDDPRLMRLRMAMAAHHLAEIRHHEEVRTHGHSEQHD